MHIQVNAQWLVSEGVQTVGVETMEGIKKRFMKVGFYVNGVGVLCLVGGDSWLVSEGGCRVLRVTAS